MKEPRYLVRWREDVDTAWTYDPFDMTLKEASDRVSRMTNQTPYQWDICSVSSITDKMHDTIHAQAPKIVKERGSMQRLLTALHETINTPAGIVPDSALEFYDQEWGDISSL